MTIDIPRLSEAFAEQLVIQAENQGRPLTSINRATALEHFPISWNIQRWRSSSRIRQG
jgi:hypothetical protein